MNCADRLVAIFGSQAEVARRLRLDRAVVSNWVKSGYVPSRWAVEVEHVTDGRDRRSRSSQRSQRAQADPGEVARRRRQPFRTVAGRKRHHEPLRPGETHPFLPSAAAHADGAGSFRDQSARHGGDEPAGDRLSGSGLRRDDGGAQRTAALHVPDQERADVPGLRSRLGRHGILLRESGRAGRQGRRLPQRRVRRTHDRERRALRRHPDRRRGRLGRSGGSEQARGRAQAATRTRAWSPSCTPKPRPACSRMPRR